MTAVDFLSPSSHCMGAAVYRVTISLAMESVKQSSMSAVKQRCGTPPKELPFVPLCDVEQSILATLKAFASGLPGSLYYIGQQHVILGAAKAGDPLAFYPEMLLHADLPRHCAKWTKDIRLLTRGDRRKKLGGK
jgi:hypothetical protein